MADQETIRLCVWITKSHFGEVVATVVQALSSHGRLSFREIVLFTKFKPRAIRASLLVLSQHNLLWHSNIGGEEAYQFNVDECLQRLRFGKFLLVANELFGEESVSVIQTILDNGRLRFPDLVSQLPQMDLIACQKITRNLIQNRFIKSTTEYMTKSRIDRVLEMEQSLRAADLLTKNSAIASAKKLEEKRIAAEHEVAQLENDAESRGLKGPDLAKSIKGKEKERSIDETVWFRVNFDKFNVHIRNSLIEGSVRARYNDVAASVMAAILNGSEKHQLSLSERRSDPLSLHSIMEHLHDEDQLASGLATHNISNASSLREYINILSSADNPTPTGVAGAFLSSNSAGVGGRVQVEFYAIYRRLKLAALDGYVRDRWGNLAVRVVRILLSMGKMDEKQIAKVAMIAPGDVRPLITVLSAASIISLHEVSKGKDFMPRRTSYFWHVDLAKTNAVILSILIKSAANILERKAAESERPLIKALLETRERTDVAEDESLLTVAEKQILKQWEDKMVKLTVLETRLDEAIFILRELPLE